MRLISYMKAIGQALITSSGILKTWLLVHFNEPSTSCSLLQALFTSSSILQSWPLLKQYLLTQQIGIRCQRQPAQIYVRQRSASVFPAQQYTHLQRNLRLDVIAVQPGFHWGKETWDLGVKADQIHLLCTSGCVVGRVGGWVCVCVCACACVCLCV
jgi:hypothetical protein